MDLKKTYQEVFKQIQFDPIWTSGGLWAAMMWASDFPKKIKILSIGGGNGFETVYFLKKGFDAYTYDFHQILDVSILKGRQIVGDAQWLPFKDDYFHFVFCCEVLEHIHENDVGNVIKEACRVARHGFFTIGDVPDPPHYTHICLKNILWWMIQFNEAGWYIRNAQWRHKTDILLSIPKGMRLIKFYNTSGITFHVSKINKNFQKPMGT